MSFSEIESMPFYEMEILIEWIEEKNKKQKKEQTSEEEKWKPENYKNHLPKISGMGNTKFKTPKI